MCPVLPPIPTDHLKVEDVPELIAQTRDTMLEALREMSDEKFRARSGTPKAPAAKRASEGQTVEPPSPVTAAGLRTEGSIAGTETSEEDAVLVDRP